MTKPAGPPLSPDQGQPFEGLWPSDTGTLHEQSRRALLEILKGPYLSGRRRPQLWLALMADEYSIRAALHNLFLDLVIDPVEEFAFVRKAQTGDFDAPSALRKESLTLIDTAMLLVLRQLLLASPGDQRVIIGKEEVYERLTVYRTGDEVTYQRNFNGSWTRMMDRFRFLLKAGEDRFEISPVVRFIVDEDQVRALIAVYQNIATPKDPDGTARQPPEPTSDHVEILPDLDHSVPQADLFSLAQEDTLTLFPLDSKLGTDTAKDTP